MSITYQITTLADVYALPDAEAVDRCMKEMASAMVQMKMLESLMGAPVDLHFPWDWTDDGLSDCSVKIEDEEGRHLFTYETKEHIDTAH